MFKTKGGGRIPTKQEILNNIGERELFRWVLGFYPETHKKYKNPLRKDTNPGTFFKFVGNRIFYIDKAWPERTKSDIFELIQYKYDISSFQETLRFIGKNFEHQLTTEKPKSYYNSIKNKTYRAFKIVARKFNIRDLNFWGSFGISEKTLNLYNVKAVYKTYLNDEFYSAFSYKSNVYVFIIDNYIKLYNPLTLDVSLKFRGNMPKDKIFGEHLIDESYEGITFITSSVKDCMVLYELGYQAIAPQSESLFIPERVLKRLKNPVIFYDNDVAGIEYAKKFSEENKLPFIHTPEGEPKDPSDFSKLYGKDKLREFICKITKQLQ